MRQQPRKKIHRLRVQYAKFPQWSNRTYRIFAFIEMGRSSSGNVSHLETASGNMPGSQPLNLTLSNASLQEVLPAPGVFIPVSKLLILCVAGPLNAIVLMVFLLRGNLRNSFTYHIMYLLAANVLLVFCETPVAVANRLYTAYGWLTGPNSCYFLMYSSFTLYGLTVQGHFLIAANRIWAITIPVHYKNFYNQKVALRMIFGSAFLIHLFTLPIVGHKVVELQHELEEHRFLCVPVVEKGLLTFYVLIVMDIPIISMLVAFPPVLIFMYNRQKKQAIDASKHGSIEPDYGASATENLYRNKVSTARLVKAQVSRPPESSRAFVILAIMTTSTTICWTPAPLYWTLFCFGGIEYNEPLEHAVTALYAVQSCLDPVLFLCGDPRLRTELLRIFRSLKPGRKVAELSTVAS